MPFSFQSKHENKSMKSAWLFSFTFPGSCFEAMFPCSTEVKQCSDQPWYLGTNNKPKKSTPILNLILGSPQSPKDGPTVR